MPALLSSLATHAARPAILTTDGVSTYADLDAASARAAAALLAGRADLDGERIALIASPGVEFVAALLGIWRAGGVAVPLAVSHPAAELDHVIRDSGASAVITTLAFAHLTAPLAAGAGARSIATTELFAAPAGPLPDVPASRAALILYTSGTTGKPKGVVITHANLDAQVSALVAAWEWTAGDRALLAVPLHHVHGLVNVVLCALAAGATVEALPRFDAGAVWARLASGDVTVFTAVPTVYHRLIESWDQAPVETREARSAGAHRARVMMSGSAALPAPMLERWRAITGHTLLERYGMTEIGMALANPLHGERRPGHVGHPLPGVEVRLVDDDGNPAGETGEL
jgi:malonyl-CoA/methylmalonyl-CoA synthetase